MEVSSFRGIRYNQRIVGDLAQVLCPPYDIITPEQQKLYYKKSDYNAIRLELPAESQEPAVDRYQGAAITFQRWLEQGILQTDSVSGFYLHDHCFEYAGEKRVRRGLIARVKLEPWGGGIYPHEETFSKAKGDRLQLMRACRANFSPLFSLYQDSERKIASILSHVAQRKPLMSLRAPILLGQSNLLDSNEAHTLWAITDPEIKRQLSQLLSSQPLYIADGHHRYETALAYQQERAKEQSDFFDSSVIASPDFVGTKQSLTPMRSGGAFNYVMMELVDFSDPGLVVLPIHRLVHGIAPATLTGLEDRLRKFFVLESVPLKTDSPDALRLPSNSCLGILGLQPGSLVVLKRRHPDSIGVSLEAMMPGNRSQAYREFGVSILNHIILDDVLSGAKDLDVAYTVDLQEAYQQVREGKYQLAFLLNPPQPDIVKAVADAQDRMPSKSTYFYPKLPAGLIINPLD
ncbi:MAG: DUF1015 domain-containing protein [Chloroflexi bacterium]|nr:DUF1015 domain-containing protein [Chloroflexota bacterium]